jgi:hypothetical protein
MVKKYIFVLLISLTLTFASAADVAYIYRKDFKIDQNIINTFNEMGLEVELINENSLPADFSAYKLIFAGDERFRNPELIPINKSPSIVANYYHGYEWGLTDRDGVSQLGATSPLTAKSNSEIIPVYNEAFSNGRIAVPYYFLDNKNKNPELTQILSTKETSSGYNFGDVISVLDNRLCFFGIIKSNYWTPQAKDLFKQCVNSVAAECSVELSCPETNSSEPFCFEGDVYITETPYSCENVNGLSTCVSHERDILQESCDYGCTEGACIIPNCLSNEDCDDSDNYTEDICVNSSTEEAFCSNEPIECLTNLDCGVDGFLATPYCSEENVAQLFQTFTCHNPGTAASFCSSSQEERTLETCNYGCSDGECIIPECTENTDCNDGDPNTEDICINPGTIDSFCSHGQITCFNNSDCGTDGFIDLPFCLENNTAQLFQTFTCNNPGTQSSFCSSVVEEQTLEICELGCEEGTCIFTEEQVHDVALLDFENAVNKIEIKHYTEGTVIPAGTPLQCDEDYKITIKIENTGNFTENVSFEGSFGEQELNHNPITNFSPGTIKTKWKKITTASNAGIYPINIEAFIDDFADANPFDNIAQREVSVSCD